jgi:DNA repair protein RadA/Sms
VKLGPPRLGAGAANLTLLAETDADRVLQAAEALRPAAVAVDSIQTQYLPELQSAPGTVTQIREVTARLMAYAKTTETPVFLVGHVTKDGAIAGPRVLEHMVDTVLYFEGGGAHPYRVLRAHKNRFGSASEIGVFEMKAGGLAEVPNPSALFLAERPEEAPGSAVAAILNGTRTVLVEVQALVAQTGYGTPRRTALGIDSNRVALLAAVLEKKVGLELLGCDLFVNVAGGLSVDDPAADLATIAALASSFRERALPARTLVLGEVGLAGEVRAVSQPEIRLAEARRLGFERALVPAANARHAEVPDGLAVEGVETVAEALDRLG